MGAAESAAEGGALTTTGGFRVCVPSPVFRTMDKLTLRSVPPRFQDDGFRDAYRGWISSSN